MKKEIAGQPAWVWALGAVVVIGGYLYFKNRSASSGSSGTGSSGKGSSGTATGGGSYSLKEWLVQHQASPGPGPAPKPKPDRDRPFAGVNPGGPIRGKRHG